MAQRQAAKALTGLATVLHDNKKLVRHNRELRCQPRFACVPRGSMVHACQCTGLGNVMTARLQYTKIVPFLQGNHLPAA